MAREEQSSKAAGQTTSVRVQEQTGRRWTSLERESGTSQGRGRNGLEPSNTVLLSLKRLMVPQSLVAPYPVSQPFLWEAGRDAKPETASQRCLESFVYHLFYS